MDKNRILKEIIFSNNEFQRNLSKSGGDYYRHYSNIASWYDYIMNEIKDAVGITGGTFEETNDQLNRIDKLTPEQKRKLHEIRKLPLYKQMMGLYAMSHIPELEKALGVKLRGFPSSYEELYSLDPEELEREAEEYSDGLASLHECGQLSDYQYDKLDASLTDMYTYYAALANGELIPFMVRFSDEEYENIEQDAMEQGVDRSVLISKVHEDELEKFRAAQASAIANSKGRKQAM